MFLIVLLYYMRCNIIVYKNSILVDVYKNTTSQWPGIVKKVPRRRILVAECQRNRILVFENALNLIVYYVSCELQL